MTDVISSLAELGFSEYEARAYVALLRRHPINGYELAKASDLPRANIYGVLQKLEARGAVARIETPDGARYDPIPPQELLPRLAGRFQSTLDAADQLLKQVASPRELSQVWSLGGYQVMLEHARSLIADAQQQLLLAVWPDEAKGLEDDVAAAVERGVAVRTLCLAGCTEECGACRGHIHRYRMSPEPAARLLVVIPDDAEVLAGEIKPALEGESDEETTRAVRTRQGLLVDLTASYIRHSIALAAVLIDAGHGLGPLLSPETREILEMVGQEDGLEGWLRQVSLDLT
jgi:predicted transcriptional regulator